LPFDRLRAVSRPFFQCSPKTGDDQAVLQKKSIFLDFPVFLMIAMKKKQNRSDELPNDRTCFRVPAER